SNNHVRNARPSLPHGERGFSFLAGHHSRGKGTAIFAFRRVATDVRSLAGQDGRQMRAGSQKNPVRRVPGLRISLVSRQATSETIRNDGSTRLEPLLATHPTFLTRHKNAKSKGEYHVRTAQTDHHVDGDPDPGHQPRVHE